MLETEDFAKEASQRNIRTRDMPFWRMREVGSGLLRAFFIHRVLRSGHYPIVHAHVQMRRWFGDITLGKFTEIHDRVVLSAIGTAENPARLVIGDYTTIWYGTVISARHQIIIGNRCAISWNCTILDDDMHQVFYEEEVVAHLPKATAVTIHDHVWIGAAVTILKGVTIGANAIVAAGSLVKEDVPPDTLVAGNPARPIRRVKGWR